MSNTQGYTDIYHILSVVLAASNICMLRRAFYRKSPLPAAPQTTNEDGVQLTIFVILQLLSNPLMQYFVIQLRNPIRMALELLSWKLQTRTQHVPQ